MQCNKNNMLIALITKEDDNKASNNWVSNARINTELSSKVISTNASRTLCANRREKNNKNGK